MSFVSAVPDRLVAAARNLAGIGSTLNASNAAAAAPTLAVSAAASDQVSAAVAAFFNGHAQGYQTLSAQAEKFHSEFVQALNAGADTYASAESDNASPLGQRLNDPPAAEPDIIGNSGAVNAKTAGPASRSGLASVAGNTRGGRAAHPRAGALGSAGNGGAKGTPGPSTEGGPPSGTCGGGGVLVRPGGLIEPGGGWPAGAAKAGAADGLLSRLVDVDGAQDRAHGVGRVSGGTRNGVWLDGIRSAGRTDSSGVASNRGVGGNAGATFYTRGLGGAGGSAGLGGLWDAGWAGKNGCGSDAGTPAHQGRPGTGGSGGVLSDVSGTSGS